jgi:GntR family transcriptional regulator
MDSRPSLVDDTELALRAWLATGSHRSGDRLPPELELAAMLGVSRGTLRTALDRLEDGGEITRRQGSGTYVGKAVRPTAFHEGLEVLRPYSELAERRGVTLTVRGLEVAERRLGSEVAEVFGLGPEVRAWTITRTILADRPSGQSAARSRPAGWCSTCCSGTASRSRSRSRACGRCC